MSTRYPHVILDHFPLVRLRSLGWYDAGPGEWNLRGAINAHWTYYRNDRDGAVIRTAGGKVPLAAGRLILVPGGCRFDSSTTAHVRHLFGYFDIPGVLHHRFARLDRPLVAPVTNEDDIFRQLSDHPGVTPKPAQILRLAARIGQALADVLPEMVLANANQRDELLAPACQLIDEHFAKALTNAELAKSCGVSINTFLRRFRAATGTTPAQAMRQRRVQAAAMALTHGDQSLELIARNCGFPNRQYLSRVFQATLAISPSNYRRQCANPRGVTVETPN